MGRRHKRLRQALAATGLAFLASTQPVVAQGENACSIRDRNGAIAIVVCPPDLDQEAWRRAGIDGCANMRPCSAWIWDDAEKAPQKAPKLATGIPKSSVLDAVAVWDNVSSQLIMITKVK